MAGRGGAGYDPAEDEIAQAIIFATKVIRHEKERIHSLLESEMYPEERRGR